MAAAVTTRCRFRVTAKAMCLVFARCPTFYADPRTCPFTLRAFSTKCRTWICPADDKDDDDGGGGAGANSGWSADDDGADNNDDDGDYDEEDLVDVLIACVVLLLAVSYIVIIIEVNINLTDAAFVTILVSSL